MSRTGIRMLPKEFRELGKVATQAGWHVEHNKKHPVLVSPEGRKVTCPGTPSDRKSLPNLKMRLRHAGLEC